METFIYLFLLQQLRVAERDAAASAGIQRWDVSGRNICLDSLKHMEHDR